MDQESRVLFHESTDMPSENAAPSGSVEEQSHVFRSRCDMMKPLVFAYAFSMKKHVGSTMEFSRSQLNLCILGNPGHLFLRWLRKNSRSPWAWKIDVCRMAAKPSEDFEKTVPSIGELSKCS